MQAHGVDYGKRAFSVLKLRRMQSKIIYKMNSFSYLAGGYEGGALGSRGSNTPFGLRFSSSFWGPFGVPVLASISEFILGPIWASIWGSILVCILG